MRRFYAAVVPSGAQPQRWNFSSPCLPDRDNGVAVRSSPVASPARRPPTFSAAAHAFSTVNMPSTHAPTIEALLVEAGWLRRLARSLADDPASADDLVQDTWQAALSHPPAPGPLRGWLATIARRLAVMQRQRQRARSQRERAVGSAADAPPSADQLLERHQVQRKLATLVAELDEPFRTAILRRYAEGETAAQIAKRDGIPAATVRWRIKKALDQMRARLDQDSGGDRRSWSAALLGFAGPSPRPRASAARIAVAAAMSAGALATVALTVSLRHSSPPAAPSSRRALAQGVRLVTPAAPGADATSLPSLFGQPGAPRRPIAGRVLIGDRPAAGAVVQLGHPFWRATGVVGPAVVTDDAGRFDFGARDAARYAVVAQRAGFTPALREVDTVDPTAYPPAENIELRLEPCDTTIAGQVRDADGNPVAGARVARDGAVATTSDEQGHYQLCVGSGEAQLEVSADGYGSLTLTSQVFRTAHVRRDIILSPHAIVAGTVVEAASGTPVANAVVIAHAADPAAGAPTHNAVTDANGAFRIHGLVPGRVRVAAFKDDLEPDAANEVSTQVGREEHITIKLHEHLRLAGRVIDEDGKGVVGVRIGLDPVELPTHAATALTQADGSFVLTSVVPKAAVFNVDGYEVVTPNSVVPSSQAASVSVRVRRGNWGTVAGRVMHENEGVGGVWVGIEGTDVVTHSDAQGHYELRHVPVGEARVFASSARLSARSDPRAVKLSRGERVLDVNLTLTNAAAIAGTVVDERGQPLSGALVTAQSVEDKRTSGTAQTDEAGRFEIVQLASSRSYEMTVRLSAGGNAAPLRPADGERTTVRLNGRADGVVLRVVAERLRIRGRVVDAQGHAVADARIRIAVMEELQTTPAWMPVETAVSDGQGRFAITDLAPASYALLAVAPDGADGVVRAVRPGPDVVTIAVARAAEIRGEVVGFATSPLVYADPSYDRERLDATSFVRADREGTTFWFRALPAGRYVVTAANSSEGVAREVQVRAGEVTQLTLRSPGSGSLRASIREFPTGDPVAGIRCHTVPRDGTKAGMSNWSWETAPISGDDGSLTARVPVGAVTVTCGTEDPTFTGAVETVVAASGTTATDIWVVRRRWQESSYGTLRAEFEPSVMGAVVSAVPSDAQSPLRPGDVLAAVDGHPVTALSQQAILYSIWNHSSSRPLALVVIRGGERVAVEVPQ